MPEEPPGGRLGLEEVDELDDRELRRMQRFHNVLEVNGGPYPSGRLKSFGEWAARRFDTIPLQYDHGMILLDLSSAAAEGPRAFFDELHERDELRLRTIRWRPPAVEIVDKKIQGAD